MTRYSVALVIALLCVANSASAQLQKNTASQKVLVFAFTRATNAPLTGDAANITAKVAIDHGVRSALTDTNPTETEDGYYLFDVSASETNGNHLAFYPESSTSGVSVIVADGANGATIPAAFPGLTINGAGQAHAVVMNVNGSTDAASGLSALGEYYNTNTKVPASLGTDAITASTIAADAIGASEVAAGALTFGTEIAGSLGWNAAWDAEVESEANDALVANHLDHLLAADYDPGAKPGVGTALLNELVESASGVSRYTAGALANAPGGAGANPNVLLDTTISSVTSQTVIVLTAGSTVDDAYNGQAIVLYDASNSNYPSIRIVTDYVGSTKTATLDSAPVFTVAASDGVKVFTTAPGTTAPTTGQIATAVWGEATRTLTSGANLGTLSADMVSVSGDATAANNLESMLDGTGGATLTLGRLFISASQSVIPVEIRSDEAFPFAIWDATNTGSVNSAFRFDAESSAIEGVTLWNGAVQSVNSVTSNGITASSIAPDAIGASEVAAGALTFGTEIAGSLAWNSAWDAEVESEANDALVANHLDHLLAADYDPGAKPGVATALLNELVESASGVSRYTSSALSQAPTGAGATNPNMLLDTTVASLSSQTVFTLTAGSTVDDAYNGQAIVLYDASNSNYPSIRVVTDYVGSTKTVTLDSAPVFTVAASDGVKVFTTAPGTTAPTTGQVADAVWEELLSLHSAIAGSPAEKLVGVAMASEVDAVQTQISDLEDVLLAAIAGGTIPTRDFAPVQQELPLRNGADGVLYATKPVRILQGDTVSVGFDCRTARVLPNGAYIASVGTPTVSGLGVSAGKRDGTNGHDATMVKLDIAAAADATVGSRWVTVTMTNSFGDGPVTLQAEVKVVARQ